MEVDLRRWGVVLNWVLERKWVRGSMICEKEHEIKKVANKRRRRRELAMNVL